MRRVLSLSLLHWSFAESQQSTQSSVLTARQSRDAFGEVGEGFKSLSAHFPGVFFDARVLASAGMDSHGEEVEIRQGPEHISAGIDQRRMVLFGE